MSSFTIWPEIVTVRTLSELQGLTVFLYLFSMILALLGVVVAAAIATSIDYEASGNPKDPGKRRFWFWVVGISVTVSNFIYMTFVAVDALANRLHAKFLTTTVVSTVITLAAYVAFGFILSKLFSKTKLGSWF